MEVMHRTGFEYEGEVSSSYNATRLSPRSTGGQLLLNHRLSIAPAVDMFRYVDYWGTLVHAFDLHQPHRSLEVVAESLVETATAPPWPTAAPDWDIVEASPIADRWSEMLAPSQMVPIGTESRSIANDLRAGQTPIDVINATMAWLQNNLIYEKGVTTVATPADTVLSQRRGVCQDFAHATISILRAARIPARYVSGYFYPIEGGVIGATVAGESHAWVEAWIGTWYPIDPTNGETVGERHVRIGHGRDYTDVPPLTGIYHGAPSKALKVEVELTRIA